MAVWVSHRSISAPDSLVDLCTGQYCDPPKDKNAWSVADGYKVVADQNPPDDCALDDTTTDSGSGTTDSTEGNGGTIQESDGAASLVCGVGAAAAAAVLL